MDADGELEVANIVIHIDGTLRRTKQDGSAVRGPLDQLQTDLELLAPKPCTLNRAHNDSTVLINDTNLLAIGSPAHVSDDTLVSIVDHLFEPVRLVQHPDNDEALLVTGGQLLVLIVPLEHHDVALMALQVLVHGKVTATLALA